MTSVLVFSPHLDDAVLSAGRFLADHPGSVVVTVFAGAPAVPVSTRWDRKCGFATSQIAVNARRAEDRAALGVLRAVPVHLDFLDSQYGPTAQGEVVEAIVDQIRRHRPGRVLAPLGVHHRDHVRIRDGVLQANVDVPVWLYGDLPYCVSLPHAAEIALDEIAGKGWVTASRPGSVGHASLKAAAMKSYASQSKLIGFSDVVEMTERFWSVTAG